MDLRNQFDPLDPRDPGFVRLSDSDPDSVPDDDMDVEQACQHDAMEVECPFPYFSRCFEHSSLPGDAAASGSFDNRHDFSLGDPGVDYEGAQKCEYDVSGAVGEPDWARIFHYLLLHFGHIRLFQTVFVLVDNRDLTAPRTDQASLAHWPTVAAWWTSRLALHGPARELCDLIFILHPTWAGTFVLAALVFLFPEVHFVLLDSDCVPVTLFEVSDLWKELSLLRDGLTPTTTSSPKGHMASASSESVPKASKLSHGKWKHQVIGQTQCRGQCWLYCCICFVTQLSGSRDAMEKALAGHRTGCIRTFIGSIPMNFCPREGHCMRSTRLNVRHGFKLASPLPPLRGVLLNTHVTGPLPGLSLENGPGDFPASSW